MPTKTTSPKKTSTKAAKAVESLPKKKTSATKTSSLQDLRSEHFSLKMKHALWELKEVHKLRQARRAIARHLTSLHQ